MLHNNNILNKIIDKGTNANPPPPTYTHTIKKQKKKSDDLPD